MKSRYVSSAVRSPRQPRLLRMERWIFLIISPLTSSNLIRPFYFVEQCFLLSFTPEIEVLFTRSLTDVPWIFLLHPLFRTRRIGSRRKRQHNVQNGRNSNRDGKTYREDFNFFFFSVIRAITEERCKTEWRTEVITITGFRTFRDGNSITVSRVFHGYRARSSSIVRNPTVILEPSVQSLSSVYDV